MSQRESWPPKPPREDPCRANAYADLHVHTSASDGCLPPAEVVRLAATEGFSAISLCDHDTVAGVGEGMAAAEEVGLELIPGIELGAYLGKSEVHILGYCLDYRSASLIEVTERLCRDRVVRIEKMVELLKKLGVRLDSSEIDPAGDFGSVGRMHVARALVQQGFVSDTKEAFARYIAVGKPAYVRRVHLSPAEACRVITQARGVPVLAHPSLLDSEELIVRLVKEGIMGIEAFYSTVGRQTAERYCRLAEKWGLVVTGGSDCHQSNMARLLLGSVKLDYRYVRELKEKAAELSGLRG